MSGDDVWTSDDAPGNWTNWTNWTNVTNETNETNTTADPFWPFVPGNESTIGGPIGADMGTFGSGSIVSLCFMVCSVLYFAAHFGYMRRR